MYCYVYPLRWNKDPAPRLHTVCWSPFPCLPIPLPSLISTCSTLSFETQGRAWMLECIPDKQDTGNTDRLACPGAPQGPACFYAPPTHTPGERQMVEPLTSVSWKLELAHGVSTLHLDYLGELEK